MATKKYLKVENGNVKSVTASGVVQRSYYTKGYHSLLLNIS